MQERERLDAEIFALSENVKQEMLNRQLDKIDTKAGQLSLKSTAKKPKRKAFQPTVEMAELQSALEAEQNELLDTNKAELYALQKQKDLAELKMEMLLQNDWITELEAKLELAKQKAEAEQAKQNNEIQGYIQLDIKLVEQDYIALAGDAWLAKAIKQAKNLEPRKMTRPMVLNFVAQYYKGYYDGFTLDEAWAKRIEDHIAYWKGRS